MLTPIAEQWAVLLKTRKRDGSWVGTPVNLAVSEERGYFGTPAKAGKVKRLRNFDEVEVAPCTVRGTPTGPSVTGRARLLEGEEADTAIRLLTRKHPFVRRVLVPVELRLRRSRELVYELTVP